MRGCTWAQSSPRKSPHRRRKLPTACAGKPRKIQGIGRGPDCGAAPSPKRAEITQCAKRHRSPLALGSSECRGALGEAHANCQPSCGNGQQCPRLRVRFRRNQTLSVSNWTVSGTSFPPPFLTLIRHSRTFLPKNPVSPITSLPTSLTLSIAFSQPRSGTSTGEPYFSNHAKFCSESPLLRSLYLCSGNPSARFSEHGRLTSAW